MPARQLGLHCINYNREIHVVHPLALLAHFNTWAIPIVLIFLVLDGHVDTCIDYRFGEYC